jgi:hypothetical protein
MDVFLSREAMQRQGEAQIEEKPMERDACLLLEDVLEVKRGRAHLASNLCEQMRKLWRGGDQNLGRFDELAMRRTCTRAGPSFPATLSIEVGERLVKECRDVIAPR